MEGSLGVGLVDLLGRPVRVSSPPPGWKLAVEVGGGGGPSNRLLRLDEEMPSVSGSVSEFEFGSPIGRNVVERACLQRKVQKKVHSTFPVRWEKRYSSN